MKEPIIVYSRGLWSHQGAVDWIIEKTKEATGLDVIEFDYSQGIKEKVSDKVYLKRTIEKYGDEIVVKNQEVIYMGQSHGGALGIIFNKIYGPQKMVLSAPAIRPFGVLRRIPNALNKDYTPHFIIRNEDDIKTRREYFDEHFDLWRDFNRVFYVGTKAKEAIDAIQNDILVVQGDKDEFINVGTNRKLYRRIDLPEYQPGQKGAQKQLIIVPGGEHAIFEEIKNKGKPNEERVYENLFDEVGKFTRR